MITRPMVFQAGVILWAGLIVNSNALACGLADVLHGKIELVQTQGGEPSIIRNNDVDSTEPFYKIRGDIWVGRQGHLEIHGADENIVGFLYREDRTLLPPVGDESCRKGYKLVLRKVAEQSFVILDGNTVISVVEGKFPFDSIW
jgi:hypothetical protein